ncbi:hypothetical protein [Klebsiella pneumoniae]|uniref:hypothetical protein n=1 Tax=Klebsiella pneumoniae TaxID=573 RepID=UPI003B3BAD2A
MSRELYRNSSSACSGGTPCCGNHHPTLGPKSMNRWSSVTKSTASVAEQLRQLNKLSNNIILEPVGRNTARPSPGGPPGHPPWRRPADAGPRRRPYHQ